MEPLDVRVLIGSLRKESLNRKIFVNSQELLPHGVRLTEIPIRELPHYNQEIQDNPVPEIERFWGAIREAEAILFISPEYNYSIPGVLKNAIDWASRPVGSAPLQGKPAAVLGASNGRSGTMRMQLHMRQVLPSMGMPVMPKPEVFILSAGDLIDVDGHLTDERVRRQLSEFYAAFEKWVRLIKGGAFQ